LYQLKEKFTDRRSVPKMYPPSESNSSLSIEIESLKFMSTLYIIYSFVFFSLSKYKYNSLAHAIGTLTDWIVFHAFTGSARVNITACNRSC